MDARLYFVFVRIFKWLRRIAEGAFHVYSVLNNNNNGKCGGGREDGERVQEKKKDQRVCEHRCIHYLTPLIELVDHFQCNRSHFQLRIAIFHHLRALHLLSSGCRVLPSKIYYLSVGNFFRMCEPAAKLKRLKIVGIVIE